MADNNNNKPAAAPQVEQDESEIRAVRLSKLEEMTASGNNPYEQTRFERTHKSEEIKTDVEELTGNKVKMPSVHSGNTI